MVTTTSRRLSRRPTILALCGAALAVAGTFVANAPFSAQAATPLGAAAAASGRVFGTSVLANHLGEADYAGALDAEFGGVTPENEMKWDATEPTRGSFSFGAADAVVSHAQDHGMKIRGHTLVWHSQLPAFVGGITSGAELLSVMKNHITTVMSHYAGQIFAWDVVNEAFDGGARRASAFQQRIGDGYIEEAFRTARAADPAAKLCYNDFGTEAVNAKSDAVLAMVRDFKARGVPIDCVGFQAHLVAGQVPADFQANLQRFADAGVDVQITELDVRVPLPASSTSLQQQASDYAQVVSACLAVARCTNISVWGVTDKFSWVPGTFPGEGAALLLDENFNRKPAYDAVLAALGG